MSVADGGAVHSRQVVEFLLAVSDKPQKNWLARAGDSARGRCFRGRAIRGDTNTDLCVEVGVDRLLDRFLGWQLGEMEVVVQQGELVLPRQDGDEPPVNAIPFRPLFLSDFAHGRRDVRPLYQCQLGRLLDLNGDMRVARSHGESKVVRQGMDKEARVEKQGLEQER